MLIATVSFSLLACGKDEPQTSAVQQATQTGAAITGVVNGGAGACASGSFTVQLVLGQSVQQETTVGVGGGFTFQVAPGTYTTTARLQNQTSCTAQQTVSASQGQTAQVNLTIGQGGGFGVPGQQYPNAYPSPYPSQYGYQWPYQYPGSYPYNYPYPFTQQPTWAPTTTYPYIWMYGPQGNGYYYWNYNSYVGPCTYTGGWLCSNVF